MRDDVTSDAVAAAVARQRALPYALHIIAVPRCAVRHRTTPQRNAPHPLRVRILQLLLNATITSLRGPTYNFTPYIFIVVDMLNVQLGAGC